MKAYRIISDAVDDAIQYGLNRAHKHTDTPDRDAIAEAVHNAVMSDLCEIVDFGDYGE